MTHWQSGIVECRKVLCAFRWRAAYPADEPSVMRECPRCGKMSGTLIQSCGWQESQEAAAARVWQMPMRRTRMMLIRAAWRALPEFFLGRTAR